MDMPILSKVWAYGDEREMRMKYERMFPHQIRKAIAENWPVVLPLGVLEYHGEHLNVGVDAILVARCLEELEKEMKLVILPPFYYGAGSYVVAKPERNGTLHVSAEVLCPLAQEIFMSLLRVGFRNVHVFIHHQSENFTSGMPTDLAFKLGARQATFAFLTAERGEGWWGAAKMKQYYQAHAAGDNPFNWIQIHALMSAAAQRKHPPDHAGQQETSLMLALDPDGVDLRRLSGKQWFAAAAKQARAADGRQAKKTILRDMKTLLEAAGRRR
jgi:creatinine amidohydrolase